MGFFEHKFDLVVSGINPMPNLGHDVTYSGTVAGADTTAELSTSSVVKAEPLSEGIALGHIVLHEPRVVVTALLGEDAEQESRRLDAAIASLRLSVDDMLSRNDIGDEGEERGRLSAHLTETREIEQFFRDALPAERLGLNELEIAFRDLSVGGDWWPNSLENRGSTLR